MTLTSQLHKSQTYEIRVDGDATGRRADAFLAAALPELSRSRIKQLIVDGLVACDDAAFGDASAKVRTGQTFTVTVPAAADADPEPQHMDLVVVYEDADVIVIDKPAGLVVHPAPGNPDQTLVNALLAHCGDSLSGIGGVRRPGIVHRIDKDTSGLIIAAKNDEAHQSLSAQFAEHSIDRAYEAVVWGNPAPPAGTIDQPVGRSQADRKKMSVRKSGGKEAVTHYRTLRRFGLLASLVECRLETGRTHQIRVHMRHIGHPLVGDPTYSRARRRVIGVGTETVSTVSAFPRQALHAKLIGFTHPATGERLSFESILPNDINNLITFLDTI